MKLSEPLPGVRVWEFGLDVAEPELAVCARVLSLDERERAARYVLPVVRSRFVVGRARLRSILGETLGVAGDAIVFNYGEHGKPSLQPPWDAAGYRFSLSHSAGQALLAITSGREIGCDLEAHRELRYGHAVAKRFFSESENEELRHCAAEPWAEAFFRMWTLKEAFIKALGSGLAFPTRDFTVSLDKRLNNRLIAVRREPDAHERWQLRPVGVSAGFAAAVCVARA